MTDPQPAGSEPRSKKIYVYWSAAFALLLALGLFSWCVLRPVLEVRRWLNGTVAQDQSAALEAIDRLGGPERAIVKLSFYLRFVAKSRGEKQLVCFYLGFCGPAATPALARALGDEDDNVRFLAAIALGHTGDPRAGGSLIAALGDEDGFVRTCATWSLAWLGDRRAIGPLEAIPADAPGPVREAAAYALKMIRARDLDYCLRLARNGECKDTAVALIAIARFHVREGMSRSEVENLLGGMPTLPDDTDGNIRVLIKAGHEPRADFHFENDRLVSWDLSYNLKTWYYPGEKFRR